MQGFRFCHNTGIDTKEGAVPSASPMIWQARWHQADILKQGKTSF